MRHIIHGMTCWGCAAIFDHSLFCPKCNTLQPAPKDYFEFFGIKRHLAIDIPQLQIRFYELSRKLHPDRYGRKSAEERALSTEATAILNDGWRILKDPLERAEYVLNQEGFNIAEQRSKDVPPELLEEVFELNMAIEELREGDASAKDQLRGAHVRFLGMLALSNSDLEGLFGEWDRDGGKDGLAAIRAVLNRRRYISNLIRDVEKELS